MDFIFDIPLTKDEYTRIIAVVHNSSKLENFSPLENNYRALKTEEDFHKEVQRLHGFPIKLYQT